MWILYSFLISLTMVMAIELPLAIALGAKSKERIITTALINIITNPVVVFGRIILLIFFKKFEPIGIIVLEIVAVIIEGFMFRKFDVFPKNKSYINSLIFNLVSFSIGEFINNFFI